MAESVLIVEDERIVALDLANRLGKLGFSVAGNVSSGEEAWRMAAEQRPDVVLMDIHIRGGEDGIATATRIERELGIPSVYVTAYSDAENIERAKASNAYGYLLKPFQDRELQIAIELALYKYAAESELRSTRNLLATTLNAIDYGVITVDRENVVLFINNHAEVLTGWNREDARGLPLPRIFGFSERQESASPSGEPVQPGSHILTNRAGLDIPVEVNVHRLDSAGTGSPAYVIMFYDISDRLAREASLIEAKEAAEAMVRGKSDFFSRISHELRTPLNVILGMAQLLRQNDSSERTDEYTSILLRATETLNNLISDVLDFNASDGVGKAGSQEECRLHDLVQDALVTFADTAEEKKLRLLSVVDPGLPSHVTCHGRYIRRILHHLISNGCKFTDSGYISVAIERDNTPLQGGNATRTGQIPLVLTVTDTGSGIPAEDRERVFEEFAQLEPPQTRTVGGVGLGLAIVRRLVAAMGGSISIESHADRGTAVIVRFSAALAASESLLDHFRRRAAEEGLEERTVSLGITDAPLMEVIGPWCTACETPVTWISGEEDLSDRIDYLLTTTDNARIPARWKDEAIVLRPRGAERNGRLSREYPVLDEPLDPWTLFRIATGIFRSNYVVSSDRIPVLLVDDDGISLFTTKRSLERRGCDVTVSKRGSLALEEIGKTRFSVACIDIEMPEMTGWTLARRIRENEAAKQAPKLPLIAVTGHSAGDIAEKAQEHGFCEVLEKPVDAERLLQAVRRYARQNQDAAGWTQEEAGSDETLHLRDIIEVLDKTVRQDDLEAGLSVVAKAEEFLQSSRHRETLFRIRLALRSKDRTRALALVDQLKR